MSPRRGPSRPRKVVAAPAPGPARNGAATLRLEPCRKGCQARSEQIARLTEALKGHVNAHTGEGVEAIAKHLGLPTSEITLPIARLLGSKDIKTKGVKRATRYFPA